MEQELREVLSDQLGVDLKLPLERMDLRARVLLRQRCLATATGMRELAQELTDSIVQQYPGPGRDEVRLDALHVLVVQDVTERKLDLVKVKGLLTQGQVVDCTTTTVRRRLTLREVKA